jgi:hypothetical protein
MAYRWKRGFEVPDESDRVDTLTAATAGAGVRIGSHFRMRVGVEKTQRRSIEDPFQNFNRTRILSTVTVIS